MVGRLRAAVSVGATNRAVIRALTRALMGALIPSTLIEAACIDGKWDPEYTWIKDCTPNNPYDGWFSGATAERTVSGDTQFAVGSVTHTLSWRLHWFKSNL